MRRPRQEDTEGGDRGESERRHGESRRPPCPERAGSAVPIGHAHLRAEHTVAWRRACMASSIREERTRVRLVTTPPANVESQMTVSGDEMTGVVSITGTRPVTFRRLEPAGLPASPPPMTGASRRDLTGLGADA